MNHDSKCVRALLVGIALSFTLCVPRARAAEPRVWTDISGKHTREATFDGLVDDTVILRLPSGKEAKVPLAKLSAKDQEYVRVIARNTETPSTDQQAGPVTGATASSTDTPAAELREDDLLALTVLSKEAAERIIDIKSRQKAWPEFVPDDQCENAALKSCGVTDEQLVRLRDALASMQSRFGGSTRCYEFFVRTTDPQWQRIANRIADFIVLPHVSELTPEAAAVLAQHKGTLIVSGVTNLSADAARSLANANQGLILSGLRDLSPEAARALASGGGPPALNLSGLKTLSPSVARALSQFSNTLMLGGLTEVAPETAKYLARQKGHIHLPSVTGLSTDAIEELNSFEGHLILAGIVELSPEMARSFAKGAGHLYFPSIRRMEVDQAEAFSGHRGSLCLSGLRQLDAEVAGELAIRTGWLVLDNLSELPVELAEALAGSGGPLALPGVTALSDEAAQAISRRKHLTNLNGVAELSDNAAAALAKHAGPLELRSVTTLSSKAHAILAQQKDRITLGDVAVEGSSDDVSHATAAKRQPEAATKENAADPINQDAASKSVAAPSVVSKPQITIMPEDAEVVVSARCDVVDLSYLTSISSDAASVLGNLRHGIIDLSGLQHLPEDVAAQLARAKVQIYLNGLESISADSLKAIGGGQVGYVHLDGVRRMSGEVFAALVGTKATILCGLEELPPNANAVLIDKCPTRVWWKRLRTISDADLAAVVSRASTVAVGLKHLTLKQAEILSQCKESLYLDSVETIDAETAKALTQHQCSISLEGLRSVANDAKAVLDRDDKVSYQVVGVANGVRADHRSRDVAAATVFAMKGAMQSHRLADTLGRAAMYGSPQDRVIADATRASEGLEALDIPMLRKYASAVVHGEDVRKALEVISKLQHQCVQYFAVVKALAESGGGDKERQAFAEEFLVYRDTKVECDRAVGEVRWKAAESTAVGDARPDDVMIAIFCAFREIAVTHHLAHAMMASLTRVPHKEVLAQCDEVMADWMVQSIPPLYKYMAEGELGDRERGVCGDLIALQQCVLDELRAVKVCAAAGGIDEAGLGRFSDVNKEYNQAVRPILAAMMEEQGAVQKSSAISGGAPGAPRTDGLSDEEWAGIVATLRKKGIVRNDRDADAYVGTFSMLKGVFVAKNIPEPSTRQLFALAKSLGVPLGQAAPEQIETTLRTTLLLADETDTEVASKEMLLKLGD
jgi:hypothetical protein